eukprot:766454-Hanusia_phi.AAC.6
MKEWLEMRKRIFACSLSFTPSLYPPSRLCLGPPPLLVGARPSLPLLLPNILLYLPSYPTTILPSSSCPVYLSFISPFSSQLAAGGASGAPAPAHGLVLVEIGYDDNDLRPRQGAEDSEDA